MSNKTNWGFCNRCNRHHLLPGCSATHYLIWDHDDQTIEDAKSIYGIDQDDALERWAEDMDSAGDYDIASGVYEPEVCICKSDVGPPARRYKIKGEMVAKYSATSLSQPGDCDDVAV